ncbi:hypothetical protein NB705_003743 [Xanthomonas sacchari]|nr:hypothetical protein [Xanthomonas sacchari]
MAAHPHRTRRGAALAARRAGQGTAPDRTRTRRDRAAEVRVLLPHRLRPGALRALQGHPVPGSRLGGELGGVLRTGHHRDRSGPHRHAVRALHFRRAQGAAGHRHRFRARPPRGSDPVHLPPLRPRARRTGRGGDQLPHAQRGTRRGARTGPAQRHRRRAVFRTGSARSGGVGAGAAARARLRPGHAGDAPAAGARQPTDRLPTAPVAASRRLRHLRACAAHPGAGGERDHGRAHGDPVGQGRPGTGRADEGRRARAGHAQRAATHPGPAARAPRPRLHARQHSRRRSADLRDDPARRHHRRVPDRIARADGDAAAAAAKRVLRPGHPGGDRAPRADPGRHGAPVSAPAQR